VSRPSLRVRASTIVVAMLAALAWSPAAITDLRVTVEPRVIDVLDTARLTIRSSGSGQTAPLDLGGLDEDFEVLSTRSSSQYRSVGGRVESWLEHQIVLRPRRAGTLTIPPVQVGDRITEPISLQVRDLAPELRDAIETLVFFETEISANPVYVQAQTILVRRLFYGSAAQIYSDLPGLPDIDGAVVMPLGETVSGTAFRDGQRYGVIEQRFAIFPERSGTLTIPEIAITTSVRLQVDGRTRRSGVRVATDRITLDVLPIPPEYPAGQPWLPAERVTLRDDWTPDSETVRVGEPVRRLVEARIEGNGSAALAPLRTRLPETHFRTYPEPPRRTDDASGSTVRGTRTESYALIPRAPGELQLPPVAVTWWDVNAQRVRVARAPERVLTISGAALTSDPGAAGAPGAGVDHTRSEPTPMTAEAGSAEPGAQVRVGTSLWLAALMTLALAVLIWQAQRLWLPDRGGGGRSRSVAMWLRDRWQPPSRRALAAACRSGDAAAMHRALLAVLADHYDTSAPAAVRRFRDDGYGDLFDRLTATLYGAGAAAAPVGGAELRRAVRELERRRAPPPPPLPALYD
jgi:hypothetical protein